MKRFSLWRLTGALMLLATATQLAGCGATAGIGPSKTACNQFLTQMKAGQYKTAYALLSTPCKAVVTVPQERNYWELVQKNRGAVQSWTVQGTQFYSGTGGSRVTLSYALKCANGNSAVQFSCVPENSKWVIQGFNFAG